MALKKPTPAFEQEPAAGAADTAVADKPVTANAAAAATIMGDSAAAKPAEAPVTPAAQAAASTAVAKASASSLALNEAAAQAKAFQKEVADMKGASDLSYGNYDVYKGNNGEIKTADGKKSFGRWAHVRLLSWDNHFEISPGEDGTSTKDFVAFSKDGQTIDSIIGEEMREWVGRDVKDYEAYLRNDEGFKFAKTREFIDTACAVLASDNGEVPAGEVVQITLSETSMQAFTKYQNKLKDAARCVAMGIPGFSLPDDPFTFFFVKEGATKGNKSWTKLKIESKLPTKFD